MDFDLYIKATQALKTKVPKNQADYERYRDGLYNLCKNAGVKVTKSMPVAELKKLLREKVSESDGDI